MIIPSSDKISNKILVIDDTPQNIFFLKEALMPLGHIYFSESASDALSLLTKVLPDIILLDIEMPEINGWELAKKLKASTRYAAIPIIFITSHEDEDFECKSLECGGVDFISKPFNPHICRLRVQSQLTIINQTKLLSKTQENLQQLVKQVPVFITYWDINWNNTYSNDYQGTWLDNFQSSSLGKNIKEVFPSELSEGILKQSLVKLSEKDQDNYQDSTPFIAHIKTAKSERFFQVFLSLRIKHQEVKGYLVTLVDISDAKIAKQKLNSEKERLRVTLNSIGDAVIATDIKGYITFMNPVAEGLTGWRVKDALNQKIEKVMMLQSFTKKETLLNPIYMALKEEKTVTMGINSELISLDNKHFSIEDSAAPIRNEVGIIIGAIMVFHDISETKAMAMKVNHLAKHDQLTDLPNRVLLQDILSFACDSPSSQTKIATLMVDIDNFKYLNDSLGHQYGDQLICLTAERLSKLIPPTYTLSRLGGDEFIIVMTDVENAKACSQLANRIIKSMQEPFLVAEQSCNISVSIGISICPDDANGAEQLLCNADVAMYKSKEEGRNRYSFFSKELQSALLKRQTIEKLLRTTLESDDLLVYYQPKFELKTQKIIGAEALVRLKNEQGEIVPPNLFLPTAEETGLVVTLGYQVLFKACRQVKIWLNEGKHIPISVNVAAAQFADPKLYSMVEKALKANNLPAEMLELEVTETALMVDISLVQQKLIKLKALGVKIAIDDFGTGYSSLAYLKTFKVDVMKIDMSFVQDMMDNVQDYALVETIISLGKSMGLSLVAEGIENKAQLNALIALGCEYGQGYLISKAVPAKNFRFN